VQAIMVSARSKKFAKEKDQVAWFVAVFAFELVPRPNTNDSFWLVVKRSFRTNGRAGEPEGRVGVYATGWAVYVSGYGFLF
jgi:hypothetical protein